MPPGTPKACSAISDHSPSPRITLRFIAEDGLHAAHFGGLASLMGPLLVLSCTPGVEALFCLPYSVGRSFAPSKFSPNVSV